MGEYPSRKRNRWPSYDYARNGFYFVTLRTNGGRCLFWENPVGANCVRPLLSVVGYMAEQELSVLTSTYEGVRLDAYVIMPNHIHMIIVIESVEGGRTQFAPTVSRIVKQFKGALTKKIGHPIWQKSFFDRVIRDENEYLDVLRYIDNNPKEWALDEYHV